MDDNNIITTPLDKLLDMVIKKGRISIKDAANLFGVSRDQINGWAKILEEHNLIEINYPPIGEPELRIKPLVKERGTKKIKEEPIEKGAEENKSDVRKLTDRSKANKPPKILFIAIIVVCLIIMLYVLISQ